MQPGIFSSYAPCFDVEKNATEKNEIEKKDDKHDKKKEDPPEVKHSPGQHGTRKHDHIEPPSPKGSRRIKTKQEDIPGGIPTMIAFIRPAPTQRKMRKYACP